MIDLRSDTVTRPSRAMLEAMMAAPVGDDVYGDDPTVNALQDYAAELSGKEAAIFLPTGTQANLVALLSHCERGEEYIVGQAAHNYLFEAGGAAVLGSIQPQPIDAAADGTLPLDKVAMKIKPDDIHFARTKLLSLENTHNGKVLPREYLKEAWEFTRERNLALHVDGARIFNAVGAAATSSHTASFSALSALIGKWQQRTSVRSPIYSRTMESARLSPPLRPAGA